MENWLYLPTFLCLFLFISLEWKQRQDKNKRIWLNLGTKGRRETSLSQTKFKILTEA